MICSNIKLTGPRESTGIGDLENSQTESKGFNRSTVMPGLVPGIHVFLLLEAKDVDGRDRPGHDEK
jgi:hypothetical protein